MKIRQIKKVTFWSLRNSLGCGLGVVFDCDEQVTRNCRVVKRKDGTLFWQIIKTHLNQSDWDYYLEQDQECLNNQDEEDLLLKYNWRR